MPENTPGFTPAATAMPPYSLLGGGENIKLLFDEELDNRRELLARARAWEDLSLRRAQNAASLDHFINMGTALAGQVGVTQGQANVSPIRTGAADTEVQQPAGAVYPPIRSMDTSNAVATGAIATANAQIAAQIAALTDIVTKLADALVPVIVKASGEATQPKP